MGKRISWPEFEKPVLARFHTGDQVRAWATKRQTWHWQSDGKAVSSVIVNRLYNRGLLEIVFDFEKGHIYKMKGR